MADTNKDLLHKILDTQQQQNSDIQEIKSCLLGDKYHNGGLIRQVQSNKKCIDAIKKQTGVLGGVIAFLTIAGTTLINWLIFRK